MLISSPASPAADGPRVLLLGAGLIGARIAAALSRRGFRFTSSPTPWEDGPAFLRHLENAAQTLERQRPRRLDIVWSAGRAGFASRPADTRGETERFDALLTTIGRLARGLDAPVVFHLLSSAGGLFEGQRHVDRASRPRPRRPYGELKLALEERLLEFDAPLSRRVYRLSSVYGPAGPSGRRGLITTLLDNALAGRTTRIVGQLDTLRDYVWTEDVARHLADACEGPPGDATRIEILASGKPTSIHEILHQITRVVGRQPAIRYAARRDNSSDITFARDALPVTWSPIDLGTAIRQLHRGAVGDPGHCGLHRPPIPGA